jgi:hypothetical protein
LNLEGVQELTKNEQKSINGGVSGRCMGLNVECNEEHIDPNDPRSPLIFICRVGDNRIVCYCCNLVNP